MSTDKLEAALRVVRAAEEIFYVEGEDGNGVENLLLEALRSASQEFEVLGERLYDAESAPHWHEPYRASNRVRLALELAKFIREFGPVRDDVETRLRKAEAIVRAADDASAVEGGGS